MGVCRGGGVGKWIGPEGNSEAGRRSAGWMAGGRSSKSAVVSTVSGVSVSLMSGISKDTDLTGCFTVLFSRFGAVTGASTSSSIFALRNNLSINEAGRFAINSAFSCSISASDIAAILCLFSSSIILFSSSSIDSACAGCDFAAVGFCCDCGAVAFLAAKRDEEGLFRRCCLKADPPSRFFDVGNPVVVDLSVGAVGALGVRSLISPIMRLAGAAATGCAGTSCSSSEMSRTKRSPGIAITAPSRGECRVCIERNREKNPIRDDKISSDKQRSGGMRLKNLNWALAGRARLYQV